MNRKLAMFFAIVSGFAVANIYYSQPLLVLYAKSFHISPAQASYLPTLIQIAYATGLLLLVPLADTFSRKKLIIILLVLNTAGEFFAATATGYHLLLIANFFIGISSISAQIIIPMVSILSNENNTGKYIGIVMSGLFAGIVFARILSGFIGFQFGWRFMYELSGIINIILLFFVFITFPKIKPLANISYPKLLQSMYHLLMSESIVRHSCLCGALIFATFSALWGSLAYLLSLAPYHYGSNIVGLFGLAGLSGVLGSTLIGSIIDKLTAKKVITISAVIVCLAFLAILNTKYSIIILIIGILILDFGSRASLLSNQLRIFTLPTQYRSRLNTIFMCIYFLGGAFGTRIGAEIASYYQWLGIGIIGITLSIFVIAYNSD